MSEDAERSPGIQPERCRRGRGPFPWPVVRRGTRIFLGFLDYADVRDQDPDDGRRRARPEAGRNAGVDLYAFDLEQLWRHISDAGVADERYRTAGGFHLKVTNTMWVNATFGRDFGAGNFHPLVALAALQWNFGESTAEDPAAFYGQSTKR